MALLDKIASPNIADPRASFEEGRQIGEQRLTKELAGSILSETLGSKVGLKAYQDLQRVNPGAAQELKGVLGTERDEDNQYFIGLTATAAKIIEGGGTAEDVAKYLGPQIMLTQKSGSTALSQKIATAVQSLKDPATSEETVRNIIAASNAFGGENKFSAKTEILEDGTTIQVTNQGKTVVKDPSGRVVTGRAASDAISTANEKGVDLQSRRAGGRTAASEQEKSASDLINRGVLAAESTATVRRAIGLLDTVETGGWASVGTAMRQRMGIEGADEAELSASLGKSVLSQLKATFGAAFTENEGARLERIEANMGKSSAGNKRLLIQALKIAERTAKRARKSAVDRGQKDVVADIDELLEYSLSLDFDDEKESAPESQGGSRFQIEVVE